MRYGRHHRHGAVLIVLAVAVAAWQPPARQHPTTVQARSEHGQKTGDEPGIKGRPGAGKTPGNGPTLTCHSRVLGRLMNRKYRVGAVKNP
jgi:hypothetical protein